MSEDLFPRLDNFHINRLFNKVIQDKHWKDCIAKDRLDDLAPSNLFTIVNSADYSATDAKAHWIAIYCVGPEFAIAFDSYGSFANENTIQYMRKVAKKYKLRIFYNTSQYQQFNTNACGFFCIFVLLCLLNGLTFKEALDHFTEKKLKQNEVFLYNWFQKSKLSNGKSLLTYLTEPL